MRPDHKKVKNISWNWFYYFQKTKRSKNVTIKRFFFAWKRLIEEIQKITWNQYLQVFNAKNVTAWIFREINDMKCFSWNCHDLGFFYPSIFASKYFYKFCSFFKCWFQSRTDQTFSEICISVTRLSKIWLYLFWPHLVLFGELTFKKLI